MDNTPLNLGAGGNTYADDDIGGVHYQRVKITLGSDGVTAGDVSASNPMPVTLPSGASTSALQTTGNSSLTSIDSKLPASGQATMAASKPVVIASNQSAIPVTVTASTKQTYGANILGLVAAVAATDIFTIIGSASKTVKVTKITVTGTQTAATINDVQIVKRSTANTGGTSSAPTVVPYDSANAAGTAVVTAYTANPTTGTLVGAIDSAKVMFDKPVATSGSQQYRVEFGTRGGQAVTLNGVAQLLAVNLNGQTIAGSLIDISVEWTEE